MTTPMGVVIGVFDTVVRIPVLGSVKDNIDLRKLAWILGTKNCRQRSVNHVELFYYIVFDV